MTEPNAGDSQNKKIVLPAYLLRRFEAFRVVRGEEYSYVIRDKVQGKTYDFDRWQFFILEVLPGCDNYERLQTMFEDRFDRKISKTEVDEFLASLADRKLLSEDAETHPLLKPFTHRIFDVEDGKPVPKSFTAAVVAGETLPGSPIKPIPALPVPAPAPAAKAPAPAPAAPAPGAAPSDHPPIDQDLPAGVQDAVGLDWRTTLKSPGLFPPGPVLKVLTPLFSPLRGIIYVVPLLLVVGLFLLFNNSDLLIPDLARFRNDAPTWEHLVIAFLMIHVLSTLTTAVVADAYKVSVDKVGLTVALGFIPRWVLKTTGAERLSRKQLLWLHGATLLSRVVMFGVGAILWFETRDTHANDAQTGLMLCIVSSVELLLVSGVPFFKGTGYYLVSAYINEPHLRTRALTALQNKIKGGVYKKADATLVARYAVLSVSYVVLILMLAAWMYAKYVTGDLNLGGSTIIIGIGVVAYLLWLNYDGLTKFAEDYERQHQFDRWRNRTLTVDTVEGEVPIKKPNYWKWAVLVCFIIILFLPYPYQAGGQFSIFPVRKQVISTDTPGLIEKVYFDGGETVKGGTVLASLAHQDYLSQIEVIKAQIVEQAAVLDNLKTLPKPEEVKLAAQDLETAKENERYSAEKAPRLEKMYKVGAISFEEYDTARKDNLVDQQQVKQKEAQLALVKVPVTADQIAAAAAKLESLKESLADYEAKVARTYIKMPFDGNILTLHLQDKINSYLEKGQAFASLEYTGQVTAQISVAESDISYVKVGLPVKLRAVSYFDDREFEGTVTLIDRNVTVMPTGNVVYVIATIDNKDGLLKTGMAGQAKIQGTNMPVWKAFTQAIVRFVEIEVWSWLP